MLYIFNIRNIRVRNRLRGMNATYFAKIVLYQMCVNKLKRCGLYNKLFDFVRNLELILAIACALALGKFTK